MGCASSEGVVGSDGANSKLLFDVILMGVISCKVSCIIPGTVVVVVIVVLDRRELYPATMLQLQLPVTNDGKQMVTWERWLCNVARESDGHPMVL